ncbi:MAG: PAS domain-containing protein [Betaproteobacteria bacterium]|nr:PAS domain-containing protein [Betaproteobacteria bacterium]
MSALERLLADCVMARSALGACGFPIAILDDSSTRRPVVYVNAAFESFFGYRADEILGRGLGSMVFRGDEALVHRMAAEQAPRRAVKAWARDGSQRPVEMTLTAVRASDGRIGHWVAAFADRTEVERLRAELDSLRPLAHAA